MALFTDDLGTGIELGEVRRVVSLVPSLTESVAAAARDLLVGATDWCTHPADLNVPRVRGTKNPNLDAIRALHPDLVLANKEENRRIDVERLRESGVPVWVTDIRTIDAALYSLDRILTEVLAVPAPAWLDAARSAWATPPPATTLRVAVPIWRDPWMVVGPDTFTSDLLHRLGLHNVYADAANRYPHTNPAEIAVPQPDLVLLPDEPYVFTTDDGPEAFPDIPCALIEGRVLTWYGPSLADAPARVATAVQTVRAIKRRRRLAGS